MFEATKKLSGGDLKFLNRARNLTILEMCFEGAPLVVLFFVLKDLFNDSLSRENILLFTLFLGVAVIFRLIFAMYAYIDNSISGVELTCSTRVKLGEKLRKLPMGFFARRDIGELNNTVLFDVTKVEHVITHIYSKLIGCIVLSTITAIFLLFIDWRLALAMVVAVPIALPMLLWAEKTVAARTDRVLDAQENTTSQVLEYLMGMKVIKSFNQIGEKFRRLDGSMRKLKDAAIKLEFGVGKGVVSYSAILEVGFVFLILLGTYLTFDGALKTEIFLIFLVISLYFYAPLRSIGVFFPELRYMEKAGGRINSVLEEIPLPEPEEDTELENYDIEFHNVSFSYKKTQVLKNISFKAPERSITALVGASGSGKTTITNLIARFWDVDSGEVIIGGKNVKDMKTDTLLSYISMVFQDVYLFNDTIFNNIKIGKKNATHEEVINAAKTARCHEFIEKLPDGYDTMVGEGGATLSGGEKQRISIARAMLKDAPIVLLDEATAFLDPENEKHVQEAIDELVKSKTLIIIAHRLSTIVGADQILVLENGELTEQGKHEELITNDRFYSHLWKERQRAGGWKLTRRALREETGIKGSKMANENA
ncbi:MAG: ABC transporter ATP-binding protein [Methanophagales archaeon]|nr:ABC transporter ATP-binding protein [Methanophagales archaeon]